MFSWLLMLVTIQVLLLMREPCYHHTPLALFINSITNMHPSTPYNPNRFGVTTGNRTQTKRITISVANRYNIATPKQFTICKHTNEPGCGIRTHVSPVAPAVLLRYRLVCLHIETIMETLSISVQCWHKEPFATAR